MEGRGSGGRQARGRNNLKKSNWEGSNYMNDDNVNKYWQGKLYPYYKFLSAGWNKSSGDDSKTLCYKVIELVAVPDKENEDCYWYNKAVSIMDDKFINTRSNNRGSCRKKYTSETVEWWCVSKICDYDLHSLNTLFVNLCSIINRGCLHHSVKITKSRCACKWPGCIWSE